MFERLLCFLGFHSWDVRNYLKAGKGRVCIRKNCLKYQVLTKRGWE